MNEPIVENGAGVMPVLPGRLVLWRGRRCVVEDLHGLSEALVRCETGQRQHSVACARLVGVVGAPWVQTQLAAGPLQWQRAIDIFDAIRPLLIREPYARTGARAQDICAAMSWSPSTLYAHLAAWRKTRRLSSLLRRPRSDRGAVRLPASLDRAGLRIDSAGSTTDGAAIVGGISCAQ